VAEPHEPSYYEIALTNRQVVVAFVVLLTCLLGAFFSGVWIGREGSVRAAQEQIVRNTPPPESKEGKNLEELEFFDKTKKAADATKSDPQEARPSLGTTLLEDIGVKKKPTAPPPAAAREEPVPPAQAQTAAATPAAPAPDPAQERRERRKARAAAAAAAAAAQQAPPEAPPPAASAPPAPPKPVKTAKAGKTAKGSTATVPKGSYVIQVFSSADQAQAERIRAKLVAGGQKAFLSPIDRGGRTMYRVRVGPFKSRDEAQKVSEKVRKGYKLDTWVTE
jgi:septal ring-binding cell division protein DamX